MEDKEQRIKLVFEENANEAKGKVDGLTDAIDETAKSNDKANESQKRRRKSTEESEKAEKSFKQQLREANAELQKSIQLYGETAKETVVAAKKVAELKDQMSFAKDISDKFNPDQKMKALGAATQVAGTGLQGVTAGMALFGGESADTQKQLLKVQAAMAFSDAISNLSNLGDQWKLLKATIAASSLATKANTAATGLAAMVQNVFTGSVATTTTGFKALKFAIAATGIGLLVVGVALLATNFEKVSSVVTKFVPGLATAGKFIMSIVQSVTDFLGVTSEADRAVDRLKANADSSIALNKKFIAEHGSQVDEFTKQKIDAKNKYYEAIKEDGANQQALAKELNRELKAIDLARGEASLKIQNDTAEKQKEKREEYARLAKEQADKEAADLKYRLDEIDKQNEKYFAKVVDDANNAQLELNAVNQLGLDEDKRIADEKEKLNQEKVDSQVATGKQLEEQKKKEADDDKALLEQKQKNKNDILATGQALIAGAALLAGKNKKMQKAAIIAEAAVSLGKVGANIATGVSKDASTGAIASVPLIIKTIATGALATASIIGNTSKALKALGGGSAPSDGGGSQLQGGGGGASSSTPQVSFQASKENQIATSVSNNNANQPPIQAFVVGKQVTTQQSLDNNKIKSNSI